jgi:suppressor of G2 allele of SKP1
MPTGSDYSLELDPLSHEVDPKTSKVEILSTKIEIQLKKVLEAIKWGTLEGDDANAISMASAGMMISLALAMAPQMRESGMEK